MTQQEIIKRMEALKANPALRELLAEFFRARLHDREAEISQTADAGLQTLKGKCLELTAILKEFT